MPNLLSSTGLQVATTTELLTNLQTAFLNIYGSAINLASNSPDAQMINIFVQAQQDVQNLLMAIYNSFDPDQAIGVTLDQRVAINGIQRQAGTYTVTPITITNSQSVNLYGLDQTTQPVYTVSDNAGNQWQLQATQLGLAAGTRSLSFQAAAPGAVVTIPNTINVPVTIVLGVTAINNPTTYSILGVNEESDAKLKIRRQISVSLASQGYYSGLLAALLNIPGVTSAFVYENTTGSTNSDGVPGHSIWVIVAGSGAPSAIAAAIYNKRNAGCGMYGSTSYNVTQVDGSTFTIYWDTVVTRNVFITFTASSVNGTTPPNIAAVRAALGSSYVPGVNAEVNINQLGTLIQQADPNTLVTGAGFSLGFTQILTLSGVPASGTFVFVYNGVSSAAVNWNDTTAVIQTKLQAITGLSTAVVTGTLAGQTLTITLPTTTIMLGLIAVPPSTNSLQTSAPAAISFTYNEGYANTLYPPTKKNQLIVSPANIIILPMQMSPSAPSVAHLAGQVFTGVGGYGSYTYSLITNNSGGSVGVTTGIYTAGSTSGVSDVIQAKDQFGNVATATITVT